eukprot:9151785-Heterocapsa_arctica.AAC.1
MKMNNDGHKEDQVHKYVHGGLLQINATEEIYNDEGQMTGGLDSQQHIPEVIQEEESAIDTQEYGQFVKDYHEDKLQETELTQEGGQKQ